MAASDRMRPLLSPQEGWISDGGLVLHFKPLGYARWAQALEVTLGELMVSGEPPLLKKRRELTREQAIKLWIQKRQAAGQSVRRSGTRRSPWVQGVNREPAIGRLTFQCRLTSSPIPWCWDGG